MPERSRTKSRASSDAASRERIATAGLSESDRHIRLELTVALCLTVARFALLVALVLFCAASYSVWGSPGSPMRGAWKGGVALLAVWGAMIVFHRRALRTLMVRQRRAGVRLGWMDTLSSTDIRKLKDDDA